MVRIRRAAPLLLLAVAADQVAAAEFQATAGYGAEYTNNSNLVNENEQKEWIQRPSVTFLLDHEASDLQANLDYRVTREIFQADLFEDETVTEGTGNLNWNVLSNRLSLRLGNTETRSTVDSTQARTSANKQDVRQTSAGADLRLDTFGPQSLTMSYTFARDNFDATDNDSDRETVLATYAMPLSENRVLALVGEYTDVEFDDPAFPSYDSKSVHLTYTQASRKLSFSSQMGLTQMSRDGRDDVKTVSGSLSGSYNVSPETAFGFSCFYEPVDTSVENYSGSTDFGEELLSSSNSGEAFIETQCDLNFNTRLGRNRIGMSVNASRQEFEDKGLGQDEERQGGTLTLDREVSDRTQLSFFFDYKRRDFQELRNDEEFRATTELRWQMSRKLGFVIGLRFEKNNSDVLAEEYEAVAGYFNFDYRFL